MSLDSKGFSLDLGTQDQNTHSLGLGFAEPSQDLVSSGFSP